MPSRDGSGARRARRPAGQSPGTRGCPTRAGRAAARRSGRRRCAGPGAGEVQPVDLAPGVIHRVVGHPHEQFHVSRLVHRPGRERSVAEVVADQRLLRYQPGDAPDRPGEALPAVAVGPRQHALDVKDLPAHIPLDREVTGGDRGGQPLDLPGEQVLIGPQRDREVMRPILLEHGKRAGAERQANLEPDIGGDHALLAQAPEHLVGLDRVVDPRPRLETQLGDTLADLEDRGLADAARRITEIILDHLQARVGHQQARGLVGRPQDPQARLPVRQREHQVTEQLTAGAQRLLGRSGRKATQEE